MANKSFYMPDTLYDYLLASSLQEADILRRLREETARMPNAGLQIPPEQGQFFALLMRLMGAKKTLEVGVFTGYSALWVALALPEDGRIVACDVSEEFTAVGKRYWAEAGVADKIDLRIGPALDSLDALLADGTAGTFDFAFIDADKTNNPGYYERSLQLLRPGGLIAVDNVFAGGRIIDPAAQDADTLARRTFNEQLAHDDRVYLSMVPMGDGFTLALKK